MPAKSKEAIAFKKHNQKLKYRNRKRRLVELKGGKCSMCQGVFPDCCYDLHHIDPSQKEGKVSQLIHIADEQTMLKEAEKCILVCSNCHRIIHSYNN